MALPRLGECAQNKKSRSEGSGMIKGKRHSRWREARGQRLIRSPAILPDFFADRAANTRLLFGNRHNPMFGGPSRHLE